MDGTGMNRDLPEMFVNRMRQQLGNELTAFLHALEGKPVRGIRLNPLKPSAATKEYAGSDRVPWANDGYYLAADSDAGATILHAAGAFYIQEPGAMLPAMVLDAKPGEKVLDLCAAPGGKSTQIGSMMQGEGLLVCNEPVPKRAQILSSNIERFGLPNTIITCERPERLADRWPNGFDAVLVDAPCSGEGMFRRDPETRMEWTPEKASGCAERQREILAAAGLLVRPGGRLVYSTCTYNPAENEENVRWFTKQFPDFHTEPFCLKGIDAPGGMYTCYPHQINGEGQFAALLRREGNQPAVLPPDKSLPKPPEEVISVFEEAFPVFPKPSHIFGKTLVCLPEMPDLKGIRALRTGLHLGEVRGKVAVPDHAAALCFRTPDIQVYDLTPENAVRFVSGDTVTGNAEGWTLLRYGGLISGWGKGSEGIIKNHYPKGLRNANLIP